MKLTKLILCFAVTMSFSPEAFAKGGSCTAKIVGKCKKAGHEIGGTDMAIGDFEGSTAVGSKKASGALGGKKTAMSAAAGECASSAAECDKCPPAEREQCKKEVGQAAGDMQAQSAAMGDAGAMLGAAAGLLGAMLPMLMKKDEEEENKQQQNPNAAMQCNQQGQCTLDCSKNDAFQYPACAAQLSNSCMNAMSDFRCVNFANRYCNAEGVGTPYCNRALAYQFCSAGGKDQCPTCMWLQKVNSPACAEDPALCLEHPTAAATEAQRPYCPNDPVFVGVGNAGYGGVAGGGTQPPGGGTVNPPTNPNLPPPILPAGTGGTGTGTGGTAGGGTGGTTGGGKTIVTQTAGGRETHRNNPTGGYGAQTANGGTGAGGTGGATGTTGGTAGRDTAGTGGYRTASTSSGPTSDINGEHGPSLFSTASQVIRNRCANAQFFHCP